MLTGSTGDWRISDAARIDLKPASDSAFIGGCRYSFAVSYCWWPRFVWLWALPTLGTPGIGDIPIRPEMRLRVSHGARTGLSPWANWEPCWFPSTERIGTQ